MKGCNHLIDAGRRRFLSGAGIAAAGAAATTILPTETNAAPTTARVNYPSNRLASISQLKVNEPFETA